MVWGRLMRSCTDKSTLWRRKNWNTRNNLKRWANKMRCYRANWSKPLKTQPMMENTKRREIKTCWSCVKLFSTIRRKIPNYENKFRNFILSWGMDQSIIHISLGTQWIYKRAAPENKDTGMEDSKKRLGFLVRIVKLLIRQEMPALFR